jgi:hypothetical protein
MVHIDAALYLGNWLRWIFRIKAKRWHNKNADYSDFFTELVNHALRLSASRYGLSLSVRTINMRLCCLMICVLPKTLASHNTNLLACTAFTWAT